MARFVVVLPLVPLGAGDEFTVADWPLHVTLVEPFQTALDATERFGQLGAEALGGVLRVLAGVVAADVGEAVDPGLPQR